MKVGGLCPHDKIPRRCGLCVGSSVAVRGKWEWESMFPSHGPPHGPLVVPEACDENSAAPTPVEPTPTPASVDNPAHAGPTGDAPGRLLAAEALATMSSSLGMDATGWERMPGALKEAGDGAAGTSGVGAAASSSLAAPASSRSPAAEALATMSSSLGMDATGWERMLDAGEQCAAFSTLHEDDAVLHPQEAPPATRNRPRPHHYNTRRHPYQRSDSKQRRVHVPASTIPYQTVIPQGSQVGSVRVWTADPHSYHAPTICEESIEYWDAVRTMALLTNALDSYLCSPNKVLHVVVALKDPMAAEQWEPCHVALRGGFALFHWALPPIAWIG
jgi:hypothetical protein